MPEKETVERAREDAREGKAPSTQAGEFVRKEMHHVREGEHGAASTRQAIAIGLSKTRSAGVNLPAPGGRQSQATKREARRDLQRGQGNSRGKVSSRRSRATTQALKKAGYSAASKSALSRQARSAARKRGAASRQAAAMKASQTRKAA